MTDVVITFRDNNNTKVQGPVTLLDGEGQRIEVREGQAIFLCRCGQSKTKPFCDASHKAAGFQSAVRAADHNAS
jgi:CDGSH-type Zn-finger protein